MSYISNKKQLDLFYPMILLFIVIVVFQLLRPFVVLMSFKLFEYDEQQEHILVSVDQPASDGTAPEAIKAPNLPSSLRNTPQHWNSQLSFHQDTLALHRLIVSLTNNERVSVGRGNLITDNGLIDVAARHSLDMQNNDYLDHISPNGDGPSQRAAMLHRTMFGSIGENVAVIQSAKDMPENIAKRFINGWMNSIGHRRNILSADYSHIGVGCNSKFIPATQTSLASEKRYCTQLFSKIYARSSQPIPKELKKNSTLNIQLNPETGISKPAEVFISDLVNGQQYANATLSNATGSGSLTILVPSAGIYGLSIKVPDNTDPNRMWIVNGPYIKVVE